MASETGTAFDRVSWLHALRVAPYGFDFHQAMRRVEVAFRELPRWGEAVRPRDEPLRLVQEPSLDFVPSTVRDFVAATHSTPARLVVGFFGLFGPHGPLPLHLTEYARDRIRQAGDTTFAAFVNLFQHRMLVLFHRAWAQSRPTVSRDRRETDRFRTYVGAPSGLGLHAQAEQEPALDQVKLYFSGLLSAAARNPDGLQAILSGFFEVPVQVREFVGEWLAIHDADRFRLGYSEQVSSLGRTAVLGGRVFSRSHKFRVVLGPLPEATFVRFLPGTEGLARLSALVRAYAGAELAWELELIPAADAATQLRLGLAGRLGFNALLGSRRFPSRQAHVIVDPFLNRTERELAS
jgi:type VI secretion system protein ImpH